MYIPVIIQARMSSKRLPGKVLKKIAGKPMLDILIERLLCEFKSKDIYVATSTDASDDPIDRYCRDRGISCFRGELENVAARFRDFLKTSNADAFVRLCGDSPLHDGRIVRDAIDLYRSGEYDLISNVIERTYPKGQSVEVVNRLTYLNAYPFFSEEDDFRHVTAYFYRHMKNYKVKNLSSGDNCADINLCVDTPADLERISRLINCANEAPVPCGWREIVKLYRKAMMRQEV